MKAKLFILFLLVSVSSAYVYFSSGNRPDCQMEVFTYSSFSSSWGAGPKLAEEFQKSHKCNISFVDAGSSLQILERLKWAEGANQSPDLVLGIDQLYLSSAKKNHKWQKVEFSYDVDPSISNWKDESGLIPIDWSPMGFVKKKDSPAPKNLKELALPEWKGKYSIISPRLSSVGVELWNWIATLSEDEIKAIKSNAHSIVDSWSISYGLMKQGQTQLAFSYLTSPIYHQVEEKSDEFEFVVFESAHPFQVEFAGVPENAPNSEMARAFLEFVVSESGQRILMNSNYMLPARKLDLVGTPFFKVSQNTLSLLDTEFSIEDLFLVWDNTN
ncbi:MAG: thiamine ABC transporter substrate-binding protein [Bdellovibrionales bacterium]|nr:thiamine ABC transporter substrate-binding protein [Bdellovibrionales bacterium]